MAAKQKNKKLDLSNLKKGAFTEWCKRKGFQGVTLECIMLGLKSKNATIRKRAQFALNARKWAKNRKRQK